MISIQIYLFEIYKTNNIIKDFNFQLKHVDLLICNKIKAKSRLLIIETQNKWVYTNIIQLIVKIQELLVTKIKLGEEHFQYINITNLQAMKNNYWCIRCYLDIRFV